MPAPLGQRHPQIDGLALQEFHDHEGMTVACFANVVRRADVRMRERTATAPGVSLEPAPELRSSAT